MAEHVNGEMNVIESANASAGVKDGIIADIGAAFNVTVQLKRRTKTNQDSAVPKLSR